MHTHFSPHTGLILYILFYISFISFFVYFSLAIGKYFLQAPSVSFFKSILGYNEFDKVWPCAVSGHHLLLYGLCGKDSFTFVNDWKKVKIFEGMWKLLQQQLNSYNRGLCIRSLVLPLGLQSLKYILIDPQRSLPNLD